jgi:hypothetical protein
MVYGHDRLLLEMTDSILKLKRFTLIYICRYLLYKDYLIVFYKLEESSKIARRSVEAVN